jgi:hypothetical protein
MPDMIRSLFRMAESAALLADEVFPEQPLREWVLSVPYPLRFRLRRVLREYLVSSGA